MMKKLTNRAVSPVTHSFDQFLHHNLKRHAMIQLVGGMWHDKRI